MSDLSMKQRIDNIRGTDTVTMTSLSADAVIHATHVDFPGAKAPLRQRFVDSGGVRLATYEWGNENDPPILLIHGGLDFARTMDVFAPMLAAGGWNPVSWDHRSHGDSDRVALSGWTADIRDATQVMNTLSHRPMPVIGHSKGGSIATRLAEAWPHRFSHVVNLDGMPSKRAAPDVSDHERSRTMVADLGKWLDHRRVAGTAQRKPASLEDLARRRAIMNPRLSHEWLCYLVSVGARHDADGWRWKIDPMMRPGGFGPYRPEWSLQGLPGLPMPFLGVLGGIPEAMGWGTKPEEISAWLPRKGVLQVFDDVGHFVHIERPQLIANMVLEFLS